MLEGDRGGLTEREEQALELYYKVLLKKVCVQCESVEEIIAGAAEEAEVFFECESEVSTEGTSDSDNGSSGGVSGVETPPTECSSGGTPRVYTGLSEECEDQACDSQKSSEELLEQLRLFEGAEDEGSVGRKTRMREAAEEYVKVLGLQMRAIASDIHEKTLIAFMSGEVSQRVLDAISDERCWYSLVTVASGGRVVSAAHARAEVGGFQRVFDFQARKFYTVRRYKEGWFLPPEASSVVCTSSKMKVWNQPLLVERSLSLMRSGGFLDGPEARLAFVNGVPGSGKTHGVIRSYSREAVPGQRLILTATRASADEVRKKLFGSGQAGRIYVRTYDSVLMHGVAQWFSEVVWDELAAICLGQFCLLMAYLQPERARGYGDFFQMEYKPFCDYEMKYPTVQPVCDTVYMPVSHRLRVSAMAAAVPLYPVDARLAVCTCHSHVLESEEGGPELVEVTSLADVPMLAGVKYLTAGQGEKVLVRDALKTSGVVSRSEAEAAVSTYAESQGITVREVIAVRLQTRSKPGSIYHEGKRANVGRSRAQERTRFYTCSSEKDAMRQSCVDARNDLYRRQVRENSAVFAQQAVDAGSMDSLFEHCFTMERVKYIY